MKTSSHDILVSTFPRLFLALGSGALLAAIVTVVVVRASSHAGVALLLLMLLAFGTSNALTSMNVRNALTRLGRGAETDRLLPVLLSDSAVSTTIWTYISLSGVVYVLITVACSIVVEKHEPLALTAVFVLYPVFSALIFRTYLSRVLIRAIQRAEVSSAGGLSQTIATVQQLKGRS